jgi:hypothetical protein
MSPSPSRGFTQPKTDVFEISSPYEYLVLLLALSLRTLPVRGTTTIVYTNLIPSSHYPCLCSFELPKKEAVTMKFTLCTFLAVAATTSAFAPAQHGRLSAPVAMEMAQSEKGSKRKAALKVS